MIRHFLGGLLLAFLLSTSAHAQGWQVTHSFWEQLAGNGTDVHHWIQLQAPTLGSSITLTLPSGVGTAGQVLTTDGNNPAALSWTTVGGTGTVTSISAGNGITNTPNPITATGTVAVNQGFAFTWTAAHTFNPSTDVIPITIKANNSTGETDLLKMLSSGGSPTTLFEFGDDGELIFGPTAGIVDGASSPGTSGQVLTSQGSATLPPLWASVTSLATDSAKYILNLAYPFTYTQTGNWNVAGSAQISGDNTAGLLLKNQAAATGGSTTMQSPLLTAFGAAWNGSTSDAWNITQGLSVNAAATTSAFLLWEVQKNAGLYTEIARLKSNGDFFAQNDISCGSAYLVAGGVGTAGHYLRSNGSTGFVESAIQAADVPSGSANYIQNQYTTQTSAGYNISAGAPAKTANFTEATIVNDATSSTSSVSKTGLLVSSTGTWNGTASGNFGISIFTSGGTSNTDILGTSNTWQVNNSGDANFNSVSLVSPLSVSNGGTNLGTLTAHSLYVGNGTSAPTALGAATNGQIPIGKTSNDPQLATITPGNGIDIANGAGSITVTNTGIFVVKGTPFSGTQPPTTVGALLTLPGTGSNHFIIIGATCYLTAVSGWISNGVYSVGSQITPPENDLLPNFTMTANTTTAFILPPINSPQAIFAGATTLNYEVQTSAAATSMNVEIDVYLYQIN